MTIVLVDMHNLFIRNWIVNPVKTSNGDPKGGLYGCLKSIQFFQRIFNTKKVIAVWDGEGGNKRRRSMNEGYKNGRKPLKFNFDTPGMDDDDVRLNQQNQMLRTMEYINELPIPQFNISGAEADDVIAMLAQTNFFEEEDKIIVSSDKDFIQLINDKIAVYFPTKQQLCLVEDVIEKYQIHPNNFVLARAVVGDKSDNIEGVKGVGLKKMAKYFPFLKNETQYSLNTIFEECVVSSKKKLKLFADIKKNEEKISKNYDLMQLTYPPFSLDKRQEIIDTIRNFGWDAPDVEKLALMFRQDEFNIIDFQELIRS